MKYRPKSLRQRKSGTWECSLVHSNPITGETVRSYHTIEAKTRRGAERKRTELIVALEKSGLAADTDTTVAEYLDSYIDSREMSESLEPSTIYDYRKDAKQIKSYLGSCRLADVNIGLIEAWMAKMTSDGYSPRTTTKAFRLLKQLLKHAVACDLLAKNPADYCKPPKRVKPKINALDREERSRMLELAYEAEPSPLALAIDIGLTTGMRRGEICALRYGDLNDDGTITVQRAISHGRGGTYVKGPKTPGSRRTLPLNEHLGAVLAALKADAEKACTIWGWECDEMYILGSRGPNSKYYNPDRLTKDFRAFCEMNGFEHKFADLRHTFATYMIAQGADASTVASLMGHSTVSMTLNVYASADPQAKREAAKLVAGAFDIDMSSPTAVDTSLGEMSEDKRKALASLANAFTEEQLEAMLAFARERSSDQATSPLGSKR